MYLGYGRAPWRNDAVGKQAARLQAAGCHRLFLETAPWRGQPFLAAARKGDILVVFCLDRLARSVRQLAELGCELARRGVSLRVLDQDLDTTRDGGGRIIDTITSLAAFDQELMLERRHFGTAACARRGGRRPALGEREIQKARDMLSDLPLTVGEVARRMGVQPSTLYRHIPGGRSALEEISA